MFLGTIVGECSAGYWCQAGSPSPTPSSINTTVSKVGPCPPGYFCPHHTIEPTACPNATFKPLYGGKGDITDCLPCPAGQECFAGK